MLDDVPTATAKIIPRKSSFRLTYQMPINYFKELILI